MKKTIFICLIGLCNFLYAQNFSVGLIPKELNENAYAVVRFENMKINFHSDTKINYQLETAITIFNESGLKFAYQPVPYTKNTKISKYNAVLYDANGKEIRKLKGKDLKDVSAYDGFSLFTDNRYQYYEFTPTSYPFTVYYSLEVNSSNTLFFPSWNPISSYNLAVEQSNYELNNLSNIEIRKDETHFKGWQVQKSENGNTLRYSLEQIPALEDEVLSPNLDEITPKVRFSPSKFQLEGVKGQFNNWTEFGQWMYENLLKNKADLSAQDKEIALRLVEGVSNPKDKVRILYQYMQTKTRYVNISIGIGGWEPFPASYVSSKSYGDCKALSNYMVSLLNLVGVESFYTIVYGDTDKKVNLKDDFASLQGNHVIVNVPLEDETLWLECTSQQTAFNHLGRFTNDRYALSVGPEGGKIVTTQAFPPEKNREYAKGQMEILPNGDLKGNLNIEHSGLQYDFIYSLYYLSESEQKKALNKFLSEIPNLNLIQHNLSNDRDLAKFKTEIKLESAQFAQIVGKDLLVPILPYGKSKTNLKKDNHRKFPFEIDFGYWDELEFDFKIPSNYQLSSELKPIFYSDSFGSYSLNIEQQENGLLKIRRKLKLKDGTYSKEKFNDFVEFRRKISSFDNSKILLQKI